MAQKTVVTVVCDLPHDGEVDGTESVSFAFDGNAYEIDLCGPHSKELREKIGAFADHARRAAAGGRRIISRGYGLGRAAWPGVETRKVRAQDDPCSR